MSEDFDAFFARTAPRLLSRAILLCGNRQTAEDAVQEAYVAAYVYWDRVGDYESPEGWVNKVMRQRLTAARRKLLRWKPISVDVPAPPGASPEANALALDVIRTLGLLPRRQREVLVLHHIEGLSYQEIAELLRISIGTVASTLAKARRKLAILLGLTPDREQPGDPLVASGRVAGAGLVPGLEDPLVVALRRADAWLTRGFAADAATLERLRAGVRPATDRRPG